MQSVVISQNKRERFGQYALRIFFQEDIMEPYGLYKKSIALSSKKKTICTVLKVALNQADTQHGEVQ